jgi:hypothetical protein
LLVEIEPSFAESLDGSAIFFVCTRTHPSRKSVGDRVFVVAGQLFMFLMNNDFSSPLLSSSSSSTATAQQQRLKLRCDNSFPHSSKPQLIFPSTAARHTTTTLIRAPILWEEIVLNRCGDSRSSGFGGLRQVSVREDAPR